MIGRAAYHTPTDILGTADQVIFGERDTFTAQEAVHAMLPYIAQHLRRGRAVASDHAAYAGPFCGASGRARQWAALSV